MVLEVVHIPAAYTVSDAVAKAREEIRRGLYQVAVVALLQQEMYGYQLAHVMEEKGLPVEEGTLYPMLRRLEEQGLLLSRWVLEGKRPRKHYVRTEAGHAYLEGLQPFWQQLSQALNGIWPAAVSADGGQDRA